MLLCPPFWLLLYHSFPFWHWVQVPQLFLEFWVQMCIFLEPVLLQGLLWNERVQNNVTCPCLKEILVDTEAFLLQMIEINYWSRPRYGRCLKLITREIGNVTFDRVSES